METCNIERCIVYYLKKMLITPLLDSHNTTVPKCYQLSLPEIEFAVMERNVCGIAHAYICRETQLNCSEVGGG